MAFSDPNLFRKNVYRLKSNRQTYVTRLTPMRDGYFLAKVFWSGLMERGYDSRWMISRQRPEGVERVLGEEAKAIREKAKQFAAQRTPTQDLHRPKRRR